ncbi:hypothetical protein BJV82DRAFT_627111 [Fennellomyces sp. T-0311]|nr:hypothetical protein BJV82DRAFT_627111 [Fennellomyces sp. T-0311]
MSFGRQPSDSTQVALFNNVKYTFHETLSLRKRQELEHLLNRHGAEKVDPDQEGGGQVTHIITTRDFERDSPKSKDPPFVVTPFWVKRAILNGFVHDPIFYSPKAEMIFSGMVVTAPTLPDSDKIAICAGLQQFGGQYRDSLTKDTTHLVAISEYGRSYERAAARQMPIILPHYFDACLKARRRIRLDMYSFPNPPLLCAPTTVDRERKEDEADKKDKTKVYSPLQDLIYPPYASRFGDEEYQIEMKTPDERFLQGDCIYVEPGVVHPSEEDALKSWLEYLQNEAGATIANEYDKDRVTIVIALNRSTPTYIQASQDGKIVASKWWLTNTISRRARELPMTTLIDYPWPEGGIPGSESYVVSISGYKGTARDYLRRILLHCGMTFAPSLSKGTTVLICSSVNQEKYMRAKEMNIVTVNHIWLEECFSQWRLLPPTDTRFFHFPARDILRSLVGKTSHEAQRLERWWKDPANKPEEIPLPTIAWTLIPKDLKSESSGKYISQRKAAEAAATSLQDVYVPDMNAYQNEKRSKRTQNLQSTPEDIDERSSKKQKSDSEEEASDVQSQVKSESSKRKSKSPTPPALESSSSSNRSSQVEKKSPPARSNRKAKEKVVDALKATSAAINFTEKPKILFTAIKSTKEMEVKLKRLGGTCVNSVDKATHLVVKDRVLRTPKFLCAVNLGINIVTLDWLTDSFETGQWQDPTKYIPKDEKNKHNLEASLKLAREMRETEGSRRHAANSWLTGFDVHFLQSDEAKNKGMYDIVTTAGGKVTQRLNTSGISDSLLVLSFPEKKERWEGLKDNGIPVYDTDMIVVGSLNQCLDLEKYRLI